MSEAFAQKLRLWFVSMMALLLGTICASSASLLGRPCKISDAWNCIGMSGQALAPMLIVLPVLAIWHAFDFVQDRKPRWWLAYLLTGYPALFGALAVLLLLHVLNATGWFTAFGTCGGIFALLSSACSYPEPWLMRPMLVLLLLLPLLTLAKGVFVAHSRLLKRS